MARGQEKVVYGGRNMIPAALGQQVAAMGASSDRIREAAQQQEVEAKFQGPAALGAGIGRGIEGATQIKGRKDEMAQQKEMHEDEMEFKIQDKNSRVAMHDNLVLLQRDLSQNEIDASSARQNEDWDREDAAEERRAVNEAVYKEIKAVMDAKLFIYQTSVTKELAQQRIGTLKELISSFQGEAKKAESLAVPAQEKRLQIKERLGVDLTIDMFKDVQEGVMSPTFKALDSELKRIQITPQELTPNNPGLLKLVESGRLTATEISELVGILEPTENRLSELLIDVQKRAGKKEVKGFVGRRIPFEGPLSDEEIKRRIAAGEEDPWWEKVLGATSGFFKKYEMEVPSEPDMVTAVEQIRKDLTKIRNMKGAIRWLAYSDEARSTMLPLTEEQKAKGVTKQRSVADVVGYILRPNTGMAYGNYAAKMLDTVGDDPDSLSNKALQDWAEAVTAMFGVDKYPKEYREKIRKRLEGSPAIIAARKDLNLMLKQIQKTQGRTDPRAYELAAAGGAGMRTIDLQKQDFEEFGLRPDGTQKGGGFLGVLELKGGGVATEYSVGVKLEANEGRETDIPSLVPTLTKAEIRLMIDDIIPNKKSVPPKILQKAVDHANKRIKQGKSPFAGGVK